MSVLDDQTKFATLMMTLGETFNEPVSKVRLDAYAMALSDLPVADVLAAMQDCIRTCKFFPRPAEIRERVTGDTEDRAQLAWASVVREVPRVGYYRTPSLPAETMTAITAVWGSWQRLCETLPADGPELLGWRKAFLQAYGASERRNERALTAGEPLTSRSQLAPNVRALLQRVK